MGAGIPIPYEDGLRCSTWPLFEREKHHAAILILGLSSYSQALIASPGSPNTTARQRSDRPRRCGVRLSNEGAYLLVQDALPRCPVD